MAVEILARRQPVQAARGPGKEAKHIGHRRNFVPQHAVQRFAAVLRLQPRQRVGVLVYHIRQLEQALGAGFRRRLSPAGKGLVGGLNGSIHLCGRSFGDLQNQFAGRRVVHRLFFAFAIDQFTINQQLSLHSIVLLKSTLFPAASDGLAFAG
ncbi:hypothetical protein D3C75_311210 [compost metagenome]